MKSLPLLAAIALTLLIVAACSVEQPDNRISEAGHAAYFATFAEAQTAAQAQDKPILVDFYTDW